MYLILLQVVVVEVVLVLEFIYLLLSLLLLLLFSLLLLLVVVIVFIYLSLLLLFTPCEFFVSVFADGFTLEFERQQVSSSLSILAVLSNAVIWIVWRQID